MEMIDNLEEQILAVDSSYSICSDKVKNAFVWSMNILVENIPAFFDPIKSYIEPVRDTTVDPDNSRVSIEDVPF